MNEHFERFVQALNEQSARLLDNVGIVIALSTIPEYAVYSRLREELASMHPIRRWLSFRKRRRAQRLRSQAQAALMNRVMEAGKDD